MAGNHIANPATSRTIKRRADIVVALAGVRPELSIALWAEVVGFDVFVVVAVGAIGLNDRMDVVSNR